MSNNKEPLREITLEEALNIFQRNKKIYRGIIIQQSLVTVKSMYKYNVKKITCTLDDDPTDLEPWILYTVLMSENDLNSLSKELADGPWYAHFFDVFDKYLIVVFKNKRFICDYQDKETWKDAINYGIKIGIPKEQLDFKYLERFSMTI